MTYNLDVNYYLSGPMTGLRNHNQAAFIDAARVLRENGFRITSPVELKPFPLDESKPRSHWLRIDLREMLFSCDGIIMLPGWNNSKGARLELEIATQLDFEILFYEELTMQRGEG